VRINRSSSHPSLTIVDHRISDDKHSSYQAADEAETALADLYSRVSSEADLSADKFREVLRRAAALLCTNHTQLSIVHYLVGIPFQLFSKESIDFGICLWLGVIHENPKTEPRILAEVAEAWEKTVKRRKGLFDPSLK
jgi:phosphatidylinositol 4-kinase A